MPSNKPLTIVVTGLRGVPDVQGGIETHTQNLYPLIARAGHKVIVFARRDFVADKQPGQWQGLHVIPTWAPKSGSLEAIVHTATSVLRALKLRPDVLHIHGIGPGLVTPLARLLGMKVIVTQHGRDYEREKWGNTARKLLRLGENLSMRFSHRMICVARNDADRLNRQFGTTDKAIAIPNGVPAMHPPGQPELLAELGLQAGRYLLNVARIVPEKRQLDLIDAFSKANLTGWKLVFVGSAMHASDYAGKFEAAVAGNPDIVAAGHRSEQALASLFGGAGIFCLPSDLEGLPISILEALSFGLPCVLSDIPANLEFDLPADTYYPVGNTDALAQSLQRLAGEAPPPRTDLKHSRLDRVPDQFHWESVARSTLAVIRRVAGKTREPASTTRAEPSNTDPGDALPTNDQIN